IFAFAVQRIFGDRGSEHPLLAVHDGNSDAQSAEVNACNDGHGLLFPPLISVPVSLPPEVTRGRFVNSTGDGGKIRGDVMFKTIFADVAQEFLHARDFDDARATEGLERIVGKRASAEIATHITCAIVRGEASESHFARFDQTHAGAKRIFLAYGAGDDGLVIHFYGFQKLLWQIAAVKADGFIRIISVVVVPVEQG